MKLTHQTSQHTQKAVFTFCLFLIFHFLQAEISWVGGTPGQESEWNCSKNWDQSRVPDFFDTVLIPNVSTRGNHNPVIAEGSVEIAHLAISSGASVTLDPTATLTIDGSSTANYGILNQGTLTLFGIINIIDTYMAPVLNLNGVIEASMNYAMMQHGNVETTELSAEELIALIEKANHCNQLSLEAAQQFANEQWKELRITTAEYLDLVGDQDTEVNNNQLYLYSRACYAMSDYASTYEALKTFLSKENINKSDRYEAEFDMAMISLAFFEGNPTAEMKAIASNYESPYHRDAKMMIENF